MGIFLNIVKNRKLAVYLAKNDMKNKFAGSYFGVFWAFVQPIITILLYWFVFQVGLRSGDVADVPFVLWLMAGLIPWFFFQDAVLNATNSFTEYSYLVKKVVFNIDILPVVKIISALFIHVFFLAVLIVIYTIFGYFPGAVALLLLYYSFAMIMLAIGIAYFTSAIAVFFKDTSQIMGVLMQIGVWVTPIMWNIDGMNLSENFKIIFKINPMYYVVRGYRDTLIYGKSFLDMPYLTIYFWVVVVVLLFVGSTVYKRLKPHFADSL